MIDKLINGIKEKNAPIVVGLDPNLAFVPQFVKDTAFASFGQTLEGAGEAIWLFNRAIIDQIYDLVPAVKPQIAMYEQFGIPGLEAFVKTVDYCHQKGLVVIGDVKRGDIGSTSEAYARGHLGPVEIGGKSYFPFNEDFVTLNPYMGADSVLPFVKMAGQTGKGVFILVKTSNPSSGDFQDVETKDGSRIFELAARKVEEWGAGSIGENGYSSVGAVVGATYPEQAKTARALMPHAYILVPGYGAQGASAQDLLPNFNEDGLGAIINSSRGIIAAWKKEEYKEFGQYKFALASRQAVLDMKEDINAALASRFGHKGEEK